MLVQDDVGPKIQIENDVILSHTDPLGGIDLVRDQATQISFENKKENADLIQVHQSRIKQNLTADLKTRF